MPKNSGKIDIETKIVVSAVPGEVVVSYADAGGTDPIIHHIHLTPLTAFELAKSVVDMAILADGMGNPNNPGTVQ